MPMGDPKPTCCHIPPSYYYPPTYCIGTPIQTPSPSILEQLGVDPVSRLAAAIEKLAEALKEGVRE